MQSHTRPIVSSAPANSKPTRSVWVAVPLDRYIIFFGIALAGCALDLLTKHWIFQRLGMILIQQGRVKPAIWLIDGIFGFETSLNEGALFGIGQGKVVFFAALSIAAGLGILVWLFVFGAARDRFLTVALGMISAGILGNLYDRLGLPGLTWSFVATDHDPGTPVYAVRDWLHFKIYNYFDWPIFNLADSLLVMGACLLILHAVWTSREIEKAQQASDA